MLFLFQSDERSSPQHHKVLLTLKLGKNREIDNPFFCQQKTPMPRQRAGALPPAGKTRRAGAGFTGVFPTFKAKLE
jgi:hypothetical protein